MKRLFKKCVNLYYQLVMRKHVEKNEIESSPWNC